MKKNKLISFNRFAAATCETIARNLGLPKIKTLLRQQKRADARKRRATMKRIITTALAMVVCGSALGADMHWCEKANGIGGNYPVCPDGYAQKDEGKYVAPAEVEHMRIAIGMTAFEANQSVWPWGKPDHVNTTTTARGTREQWVYGGGRYLYFVDNILTTISD